MAGTKDLNRMKECVDEGLIGYDDLPIHYRVMNKAGKLTETIHSSREGARREAANIIRGGKTATIFLSLEYVFDRGATLEIREPDVWS